MWRRTIIIRIMFIFSLFFINYAAADTSAIQALPHEQIISLGRVPDGLSLIRKSLKFTPDLKNVTYVMFNKKKRKFCHTE